jgi:sugar-phosphatase
MPRIVAITGAAGSGKSTIALAVARKCHAAVIDGDAMFGPLMPLLERHARHEIRSATQGALAAAAAHAAAAGIDVLVVAPFTLERRDRRAWLSWARAASGRAADVRVELAWVAAPRALVGERLGRRGAERDAGKLARLDDWLEEVAPEQSPIVEHLRLDGTNLETATEAMCKLLYSPLPPSAVAAPTASADRGESLP